jgi:hypothetical protein
VGHAEASIRLGIAVTGIAIELGCVLDQRHRSRIERILSLNLARI